MNVDHLIDIASTLLSIPAQGRPRQANLRRAVSTSYYAMFHFLASSNADLLVGTNKSNRSERAWVQAYRALDHGQTRDRCQNQKVMSRFPMDIQNFADVFCGMQINRHEADYHPGSRFELDEVWQDHFMVTSAIKFFGDADRKDKIAFAVYVLMNYRKT